MWIYGVGLGLGLAVIQRLDFKRTRARLVTRSGEWNHAAIERHVVRSMGIAVWAVWLMFTLIWQGEIDTAIYSAMTAAMVGAGAGLAIGPHAGRCSRVSVAAPTQKRLAREIAAVGRAGGDAMFWGFLIPILVAAGTGAAIAGATNDLIERAWLMVGIALGVHWLKEKALAYKNAVHRFMADNRGLDQEIKDLDDMRKDPGVAPEAVGLLLPILSVMEIVAKWVWRRSRG